MFASTMSVSIILTLLASEELPTQSVISFCMCQEE